MKKTWIFVTILTLLAVFFATANVMASPVDNLRPKKTPDHTMGPQTTEIGPHGNPHGNGDGITDDHGNNAGNGNDANHGKGNGNNPGKGTPRPTDEDGRGKPHTREDNYTGTIASVDATSLTLTLGDGSTANFVLTDKTAVKIPTLGKSATPADLKTGQKVTVRAYQDTTLGLVASMIMVIPGKPEAVHRVGTVTDYLPGVSITIQDKDGLLSTFLLTPQTKILPTERTSTLAVGVRVTIISPRDVTGGPLTAYGIVIHPISAGTQTSIPTVTATDTPTFTPTFTETATDTETAAPTP
jgi:hypothetical protein